ncbi:MAG: prenyltransferase [Bacteroidetes bacterium]|nr:prenyltransferase [Bacteroidota bacterium]
MNKESILALIRLIRLPNLGIIILTQFLLRYCVIVPILYTGHAPATPGFDFFILVLVSVLIAAGGYIINDIYDVETDRINRPEKPVIERIIPVKTALVLYFSFTITGTVLGFFLAYIVKSLSFGLMFLVIILLLWFYAVRYKKMMITGNLVVSFLSAFSILVVWLFELFALRNHGITYTDVFKKLPLVWYIILFYAVFAFFLSWIREIIKDIEDMEGDRATGCRSFPVVRGVNQSKWLAGGLIALVSAGLIVVDFILCNQSIDYVMWYLIAVVQLPLVLLAYRLSRTKSTSDFQFFSLMIKIIMVAGILSLQVFYMNMNHF